MGEVVVGRIDQIIYREEQRGFTVATMIHEGTPTTIVGQLPSLQLGETIRCWGEWRSHPQHGKQFEVETFVAQTPSDIEGMTKYLSWIKGIGPVIAQRIVEVFGLRSLQILDDEPSKLMFVPGLGEKKVSIIAQQWQEQKELREVILALRQYDISPLLAQKLYKLYGSQCLNKLQQTPFAIAREVHGIGFQRADQIAKAMGILATDPQRIKAGLEHTLWQATQDGHVCLPIDSLIEQTIVLLQLDKSKITTILERMVTEQTLYQREKRVWLPLLFHAEREIVHHLNRLQDNIAFPSQIGNREGIDRLEKELKLNFTDQQKESIIAATSQKTLIITGGPGTGKSTITRALVAIAKRNGVQIALTAPTGRAAKRLQEITGSSAGTIHSVLRINPNRGFQHNQDNPLKCDLLIVDEASMVDTLLMNHLLRAVPSSARLVLIGDVDQLPSVGAGNVLRDLIESNRLPKICLTEIFRQAKGSQIISNAHRINRGEMPKLTSQASSDFFFLNEEDPEKIQNLIVDLVSRRLPKRLSLHPLEDIQVLSPMKKGPLGIQELNGLLQGALNPGKSKSFRIGDKVMQMRNNYNKEVYNGDIGKVVHIDSSEQSLLVDYDTRQVPYASHELDDIQLAYAVSIHKYQGSESPCIVLPLHLSHFKLLNRNLLYTALTRGKRLVILIGSKKAVGIAVRSSLVKERHTGLISLLQK